MEEPLLIVVHPSYIVQGTGWVDERHRRMYGDYGLYLRRVMTEVTRRGDCLVMPYKKDELPFRMPKRAEVWRDRGNGYAELVDKLKRKHATKVELCGEFLWQYYKEPSIEDVRKARESWPQEKFKELERIYENKGKLTEEDLEDLGLTKTKPFQELLLSMMFAGNTVIDGCVRHVARALSDFDVNIIRELCYPLKEPGTNPYISSK